MTGIGSAGDGGLQECGVVCTRLVATDVRLIELRPRLSIAPYRPGSHVQVEVEVGGQPETRNYSLVGEPNGETYSIAVRLKPNGLGGSAYMHGLRAEDVVRVGPPVNNFELVFGQAHYVLVAGGIGITPIVGMASALRRRRADYELVYVGRSIEQMPFVRELREEHAGSLKVLTSASDGRPDLASMLGSLRADTDVYLCGPQEMRESAIRAWRELQRPMGSLRVENFASSAARPNEPFTVVVRDYDQRVDVPSHVSMLDALSAAGVEVLADCLRGECGLCAIRVVEQRGWIDHRDAFLSERQRAAGTHICACVSRVVGGSITVDTGRRPGLAPSGTHT